jgi:hypothetical protein
MAEPQPVVLGPRKRKATSQATDNADPLLIKKKARALDSTKNIPSTQRRRHPSIQESETNTVSTTRQGSPKNTDGISPGDDEEVQEVGDLLPDPTEIDDDEWEELEESAEDELRECLIKVISYLLTTKHIERLLKHWNTPVYAFFKPTPAIDHSDGRRAHIFECSAKVCRGKGKSPRHVRRYLNTSDSTSTSNLRRHAKICWGEDAVAAAGGVKNVYAARAVLAKPSLRNGSIAAAFERVGKANLILPFPTRPHTKTETQ